MPDSGYRKYSIILKYIIFNGHPMVYQPQFLSLPLYFCYRSFSVYMADLMASLIVEEVLCFTGRVGPSVSSKRADWCEGLRFASSSDYFACFVHLVGVCTAPARLFFRLFRLFYSFSRTLHASTSPIYPTISPILLI